ncbi:MAG TPA: hypothetical protein DCL29_07070 [Eubacterium sp.]|nr:hypothetical protein [Eubacterium sp.]
MIIETTEILDKDLAREESNILVDMSRYVKNPKTQYKDYKSFALKGIILVILLMITVNVIFNECIDNPDLFYVQLTMIVLLGGAFIILELLWISANKAYKGLVGKEIKLKYVFDKEKVECDVIGENKVTLYWNSVNYIKTFDKVFCIIPKDMTGIALFMEMKYFEQVKQFIKENNINVNTVE